MIFYTRYVNDVSVIFHRMLRETDKLREYLDNVNKHINLRAEPRPSELVSRLHSDKNR